MPYHHFALRERGKIELMLKQGQRSEAIAGELGYNSSSIRREIRRNTTRGGYDALVAQRRSFFLSPGWQGHCLSL